MTAYIIANASIIDAELLIEYSVAAGPTLAGFAVKPLVVTNESTVIEGTAGERVVVLEFPTREAAEAWYHSDAYQAIISKRLDSTRGFLVLCDGYA